MSNPGKIGIDLGTTFSCCGVFKNDRVELVTYNEGTRTVPSHVYYNPDTEEITVGNAAKNSIKSVGQTVYDSKRFIGKKFEDPEIQSDIKHWPFIVKKGLQGEPIVEVKYNKNMINLTANDVSTEILKKIKETADSYYGQDSKKETQAVITVPAYFNNQQRQNTIEAAKKANLKVIKIINEPTAAAIAYAYQRIQLGGKGSGKETLLIYDFGGGTFDVSIIQINFDTKEITVLATGGDSHLGGEDIDQKLVEHFLGLYKKKSDKEVNKKKLFKLKKSCEATKCLLSAEGNEEATVDWEPLEDEEIDTVLSRPDFDKVNRDYFIKTMDIVDEVLSEAGLSSKDIDYIVLVGGSSRIPKVQKLLQNKFPLPTVICKDINPDEVVAYGACLYANLENMHFEVQDIITHTISTDVEEGGKTVLHTLIPKNTQIPYQSEKPLCFANFEYGADHIDISVFEGEGKYPDEKGIKQLDSVPFKIPIKNVEAQKYIIETYCDVDENGVLTIRVKDRQTGKIENLKIELK